MSRIREESIFLPPLYPPTSDLPHSVHHPPFLSLSPNQSPFLDPTLPFQVMVNVSYVTPMFVHALLCASVMSVTMAPTRGGAPSVEVLVCLMLTTVRSAPFKRRM